ncbi:MAG: hypothetical protein KGL90_14125 [Burkholderiales bacterium]|nr:hypothetical protein [Burkholderiales bacterium]
MRTHSLTHIGPAPVQNSGVMSGNDLSGQPVLPTVTAMPFREPLKGLKIRELTDDDLFVNLFGTLDQIDPGLIN